MDCGRGFFGGRNCGVDGWVGDGLHLFVGSHDWVVQLRLSSLSRGMRRGKSHRFEFTVVGRMWGVGGGGVEAIHAKFVISS